MIKPVIRHGLLSFLLSCTALAQTANPQSAALDAIREYAAHYIQSLPDYACTQVTHRKISVAHLLDRQERTGVGETEKDSQ